MTINDSGQFWLDADETDGTQCLTKVAGHLSITEAGAITLDLVGTLTGDGPFQAIFDPDRREHTVRGFLKGTSQHVLLSRARSNGGRYNDTLSSERLTAESALLSFNEIAHPSFDEVILHLNGLETWAPPGEVQTEKQHNTSGRLTQIQLTISTAEERAYQTNVGSLRLQTVFIGSHPRSRDPSVNLAFTSTLTISPRLPLNVDDCSDLFEGFQDLILLLSNSQRSLDWPTVRQLDSGQDCRLYFRRGPHDSSTLNSHDCWLTLTRLDSCFANVVNQWFRQRKELGPGLHLFLGTKRSRPLYVEHRFANLAWGMEALHRRTVPIDERAAAKLREKASRIQEALKDVSWAKKSDERWAMTRLALPEPPLSSRIAELLNQIGLDFDPVALRSFSDRCNRLRNELFHHGGEKHPGTYADVIEEYVVCGRALGYLYHLLLLRLINVDRDHLKWLVDRHTLRIRDAMQVVGLLSRRGAHAPTSEHEDNR